jgi:hypothetical protein
MSYRKCIDPRFATLAAFALVFGTFAIAVLAGRPAAAQQFNTGSPEDEKQLVNYERMTGWFDSMKASECAKCHDGAGDDASKGRFSLKSFVEFRTSIALRHGETRAALVKATNGNEKELKRLMAQPIAKGLRKPRFVAENDRLADTFQCRDKKGKHPRELTKSQKQALEDWRGPGLRLQKEAVDAAVALVMAPKPASAPGAQPPPPKTK